MTPAMTRRPSSPPGLFAATVAGLGLLVVSIASAAPSALPIPPAPAVSGTPMTLGAALRAAADRNLSLQALRQEVPRADAQLSAAWGQLLPGAAAGLRYSRADHADTMDLMGGLGDVMTGLGMPAPDSEPLVVRRQDDVSATLGASVRLVDLRAWATLQAARQGVDLAELSVAQARQQLLLATGQAHALALTTGQLLHARESQLSAAAHHLQAAERRVAEGTAVELDVVRAQGDLAQAKLDLVRAQRGAASARDALGLLVGSPTPPQPVDGPLPEVCTLLGLPPSTSGCGLEPPSATPPAIPQTASSATATVDEALVARALRQRPDLKLRRASVQLADRQVRAAYGALLPTLDAAWQGSYQVTEPTDMGDPDRSRWTALLTLNIPLYNHAAHAQVRAQRAAREQARLQAKHAEREATLAVRRALRDYQTARSAVGLADQQLHLAQRGLALAEAAFAAGAGSSLEVTDGRHRATAAEVGRAAAALEVQGALLGLLEAAGVDLLAGL